MFTLSFLPSKSHGCEVDFNIFIAIVDKWKHLQSKFKMQLFYHGVGLIYKNEDIMRQVSPLEYWNTIIRDCYLSNLRQHASIHVTTKALRAYWNMNPQHEYISQSFIVICLQPCKVCYKQKIN